MPPVFLGAFRKTLSGVVRRRNAKMYAEAYCAAFRRVLWEYRAWRGGKPPCWPRYAFFSGKNNFRGRKAILRAKRRIGALSLHVRNNYFLEEF